MKLVASETLNGTSSTRASVRASSVFPVPVGPMAKILLFSKSGIGCRERDTDDRLLVGKERLRAGWGSRSSWRVPAIFGLGWKAFTYDFKGITNQYFPMGVRFRASLRSNWLVRDCNDYIRYKNT